MTVGGANHDHKTGTEANQSLVIQIATVNFVVTVYARATPSVQQKERHVMDVKEEIILQKFALRKILVLEKEASLALPKAEQFEYAGLPSMITNQFHLLR